MISEDTNTSLKREIEHSFLVCVKLSSTLKSIMYNHKNGNINTAFDIFRENLDELFTMSSDSEKLNTELVESMETWLSKPMPCTPKNVAVAIELFSRYKSDLFKRGILTL